MLNITLSNSEIDYAITKNPLIQEFIQQGINESTDLKECEDQLKQIFGDRLENETNTENIL